ncbi:hypothetical protein [Oleiagrimonas soli]|uniref:Lipoprotein n=1 Tax=Oleiagrimonas soli TaxID=1543381 RepID=A0A099CTJ5_9GAMM|nr:hypothetical protein [Oleiagrimonas soli]KGI76942.1 hypothetical protein LF63_0113605 [Oleiagrimonas soli]MBB6185185.1 hypothetical protein [Oleiagrimonas soli]
MKYGTSRRMAALVVMLAALGACSRGPTPEQQAAARKAAMEASAQDALTTYRKMVDMKSYSLAVPLGEEIVSKYPGTKAAAEVKPQLDDLRAKAKAKATKERLQRLWVYQVAPMAGGTQSTAAISVSRPAALDLRLILRRHSDWGLSVFLYADGSQGFVCKGDCTVPVTFDDTTVKLKAYVPQGGRPALMFRDEKAFIAKMEKASIVHIKVDMKGTGERDLEFEVGGFDPSSWKPLPKKK